MADDDKPLKKVLESNDMLNGPNIIKVKDSEWPAEINKFHKEDLGNFVKSFFSQKNVEEILSIRISDSQYEEIKAAIKEGVWRGVEAYMMIKERKTLYPLSNKDMSDSVTLLYGLFKNDDIKYAIMAELHVGKNTGLDERQADIISEKACITYPEFACGQSMNNFRKNFILPIDYYLPEENQESTGPAEETSLPKRTTKMPEQTEKGPVSTYFMDKPLGARERPIPAKRETHLIKAD